METAFHFLKTSGILAFRTETNVNTIKKVPQNIPRQTVSFEKYMYVNK